MPYESLQTCLICLAQDEQGSSLLPMLTMMLPLMLLFYLMFVMPQQQKDKKYRAMVSSIKEKDHVVTTGGVYGVVTSVQRDQQRVTIRIDDATGAKMRVGMWAISQIISDEPANGESSSKK